jgi:type IV secretory pathway TraG/TraD family ATPase VirD4
LNYLRWGEAEIHRSFGSENFLTVGAIGSGKTTLISMLMKSVFDQSVTSRKLVFDPRAESLPMIFRLAGDSEEAARSGKGKVKVLNPFDLRGFSWNLAKDIDGPLTANQLAEILIPSSEDAGEGRFYDETVRGLLAAIALAFIECVPNPQSWTFRDLILALMWEPYTRFILDMNKTRDGRPFMDAARYRGTVFSPDDRLRGNLRATITTKLRSFPIIAASWHAAEKEGRFFSLTEWAEQGSDQVLVVGTDDTAKETLDRINLALFQRAFELMLGRLGGSQEEKRQGLDQSWVFLDELGHAGRLPKLELLITKGRPYVCTVLGFQDIDSIRQHFGKELANVICGQCSNMAFLRLNSGETASWCSDMLGRRLMTTHERNQSSDDEGRINQGRSKGQEERPYVHTADFLYLPVTGPSTGLTGFFKSPNIDPEVHDLKVSLNWNTEIAPYLPRQESLAPDSWRQARMPRPISDHFLQPWDEADMKRLGFKCPPPDWDERSPDDVPPTEPVPQPASQPPLFPLRPNLRKSDSSST